MNGAAIMVNYTSFKNREEKIAIVGLGYVGLPLAVHFSKHFNVVGYDLKEQRIQELIAGHDRTLEISDQELATTEVMFTDDPTKLKACKLIIVAVPTPIDEYRIPDLEPLRSASRIVGEHFSRGACVVYESTVYPGATEEVCVPILEEKSGLVMGKDFTIGYSPERINPGDKMHTLENIMKIVSGSDEACAQFLARIYGTVVTAGIHKASSIKVAEAAKVIENTQRDLNIALMNELAKIFDNMGIDTLEVLQAAGTKWNFLPFRPGLVGGHCIGVDPYYLTFKAEALGYHPEMILAGRRINDGMGKYIAEKTVKQLIHSDRQVHGARVGILGLTFKEDVPDLRNTRVVDIIKELEEYGITVLVHDPLADAKEAQHYYGLELHSLHELKGLDAVVVAVQHKTYLDMGIKRIGALCRDGAPIIMDVKGIFDENTAKAADVIHWRL
jgi:UDP-N-acetyl-D-glucosamine/UDP-N-acetyl-D-galactosamine dehydrogenase